MACQDNMDFMAGLPDESMKLVVTSPPYNLGKLYEKRTRLESYVRGQERVIAECVRLLSPSGSLCWQTGNYVDRGEVYPLDAVLYPIFKEHGLRLRNRVVWHFEHGLHCTRRLSGRYETINWFIKGDDYTFNLDPIRVPAKYPGKRHFKGPNAGKLSGNPNGKNPGDVWVFPNVKNNHVEKTVHPVPVPCRAGGEAGPVADGAGRLSARSLHGGGDDSGRSADARPAGVRLRRGGAVRRDRP